MTLANNNTQILAVQAEGFYVLAVSELRQEVRSV